MEPIQAPSPTVPAGSSGAPHDWLTAGLYYDYRQAANPVRPGLTEPIRYHQWGAELNGQGPTAVLPIDLSGALGCGGPATSPGLAAHFLRLLPGEGLKAAATATS